MIILIDSTHMTSSNGFIFGLFDSRTGVTDAMEVALVVAGLIAPTVLLFKMRSLNRLRRQEKVLRLNFNDEMRKINARGMRHTSRDWFIRIEWIEIFIVHRSYIQNVGEVKMRHSLNRFEYNKVPRLTITTIDGRKMRLKDDMVYEFNGWYTRGVR